MGCVTSSESGASAGGKHKGKKMKQDVSKDGIVLDDIHAHYVIEKDLGHGHFGVVRLAKHRITGRRYAVKSIDKKKLADEVHLLKRELDVLRSVDHPNIIKFYETYEDKQYFHLVMELCTGGELFDRIIALGHFRERDAARLMRKIVSAINHCHDANICHRDLKPENFLFESEAPDAEIKIIDFGLSTKYGGARGEMTEVVGTPYYVAPEVLKGHYTNACDMWSLGVITYILLCGCPPFDGDNNTEIFRKVASGHFSFSQSVWKSVSGEAKDFIRKLLTSDPQKRLTAQQALNHPWLARDAPELQLDYNIVQSLRNYSISRNFKKEALSVIVKMLTDEEIAALKDAFHAIDTDSTGTITFQELREAMAKTGINAAESEIKKIMDSIDFDNNGRINYSEFLAATMSRKTYLDKEKLWAAFRHFDVDGTGKITAANLKSALARAGKNLSDEEIGSMIREADINNDSVIEFDEFVQMMRSTEGHQ